MQNDEDDKRQKFKELHRELARLKSVNLGNFPDTERRREAMEIHGEQLADTQRQIADLMQDMPVKRRTRAKKKITQLRRLKKARRDATMQFEVDAIDRQIADITADRRMFNKPGPTSRRPMIDNPKPSSIRSRECRARKKAGKNGH